MLVSPGNGVFSPDRVSYYVVIHKQRCTAQNTVISPNFMVWKFFGKAQFPHSFGRIARNCENCAFPQNFYTRKLGEITVFYAVMMSNLSNM